jgi:hypothetical protein
MGSCLSAMDFVPCHEGIVRYSFTFRLDGSDQYKNAELSEFDITPILCASCEREWLRLSTSTAFEPTDDTDYPYTSEIRTG